MFPGHRGPPLPAPGPQCHVGMARPQAGPRSLLAAESLDPDLWPPFPQMTSCGGLPRTAPSFSLSGPQSSGTGLEAQPESPLNLLRSELQWDVVVAGDLAVPESPSPPVLSSRAWNAPAGVLGSCGPCPLPHWQPRLPLCSLEMLFPPGASPRPPSLLSLGSPRDAVTCSDLLPSSCRSAGKVSRFSSLVLAPRNLLCAEGRGGKATRRRGLTWPADRCPHLPMAASYSSAQARGEPLSSSPLSASHHVLKPKLTGMNVWLPLLPSAPLAGARHTSR